MPERIVKTTLLIDDHGSVKVVRGVGDESLRTEGKLKTLDKQVKNVGKSFGGLKSMIGVGLGAVGVGGLAFGLADIANKTKEVAAETEKFHTITGIGASQSLAYSQALKARGLSGESVTKAFGFLAKNLKSAELQEQKYAQTQATAAAKGKVSTTILGRQATALKELGISLGAFNNLSEAGKLEKITKSFEAMAPGIQKTRLERELFGRGGNQLSTVLEKNNLGLSHQIELVKKFFPEIKGGANSMNELLEKQAESKMAWEGLEFTIGQKLIPVMTKLMGTFSTVVSEIERGKGPAKDIAIAIGGIGSAIVVGKVISGVAGFAAAMKGLATASILGSGPLGLELLAIVGIIKAFEAISGKPIFKRLAEETGLLPHEVIHVNRPGAPALSAAQSSRATLELLRNPRGLSEQITGERGRHEGIDAAAKAALQTLKVDLHLDSLKVAEAMLTNPRAQRGIAEAAAIYGSKMSARR